jgi:hypothetical protein
LLEFSFEGLDEAANKEKYISEFFQNLKIWLKENDLKRDLKFDNAEKV